MKALLEAIANRDFATAESLLEERITLVMEHKLVEMKRMTGAVMVSEMNLNREKPDYASIEDKRKDQVVSSHEKSDLPKPGNTTVIKKNSSNPVVKEEEQLDESRFKIVRVRIRGGKVQRRKKVATVKGMTIRGGKLIRMSPAERRRRKLGQRRGKIKRKSKLSRTLMKRKRSMIRRKSMGLK